jgi:pyruvate/2-oxoacid:ferredoxin oxidoreductase alpha subunit
MVCYDGYILSHTVMPVAVPTQEDVDAFLPSYKPHTILDPSSPRNINQVTLADPRMNAEGDLCHGYMEFRYLLEEAIDGARGTIAAVDAEFGKAFGRTWGGLTWTYKAEDAEVLLCAAGSLASEATVAVDRLREAGVKAGVLGIRCYRPFPKEQIIEQTKSARLVVVFDKSLSYGNEGPICADIKAALYASESNPAVFGFVAGLGGRDIKSRELANAVRISIEALNKGERTRETGWINCQIDADGN